MMLVDLATLLRESIGESDCETLRDDRLAQPVNAITSSAYVAVGAVVVASGRIRGRELVAAVLYGICLVGIGLGSILFHGPQPAGSRILHDLPILLTVVFIAVHDLDPVWIRMRHPMRWFVGAVPVATALTLFAPDVGGIATAIGVGAISVLEAVIARRRLRPMATGRPHRWHRATVGVSAVAASWWLLGRSDSFACDPDSVVQFHGLWHLLSAVLLGLWWWLAFEAGRSPARGVAPNAPLPRRSSSTPGASTPHVDSNRREHPVTDPRPLGNDVEAAGQRRRRWCIRRQPRPEHRRHRHPADRDVDGEGNPEP